ncbi:hypothetical protein BBAD15_g12503 [Beauveria bassiana D1-5]|uniref:Uncharacterized protein n=1 Tax=Beauveria bassiana D1-5 TaxID=1245745 RepID=A0A0A2V7J4_BEABA|nr:hypothetical protein BBAD15_g12503 [Beauveria bassiana D1-5]
MAAKVTPMTAAGTHPCSARRAARRPVCSDTPTAAAATPAIATCRPCDWARRANSAAAAIATSIGGTVMPRPPSSAPGPPRRRKPIQMARFTTFTPGNDCASARPLRKSDSDSQRRCCTNSRIIQPLSPPPKLVRPTLAKARKICGSVGGAATAGSAEDMAGGAMGSMPHLTQCEMSAG